MAFNRYLHQLPMAQRTPAYSLRQALYFTRMCGYLVSQKVPLSPFGIDWHDLQLVKLLPADQYVVQVDMARPIGADTLTLRLKIDFPIGRATETARLQYDQAKLNALQQLKKAKRRAFEVWSLFDEGQLAYEETEEYHDLKQFLVEEERVQKYRNDKNITRVHVKNAKDDCTAVLRRVLLATIDILDANPGFEELAAKNHLHRYLFVQKHELTTNAAGTLVLLRDGTPRLWPDIRNEIRVDPSTGVMLGQYNYEGFIERGVYDWDVLTPFYVEPQLPPPWGDRYLFEFCSWIVDRPRMMGDHTFIRLKTPQGEWYSMGFHEQFVFPMKIKASKFMSPDVSEYWNGPCTSLSVEVTKEQFERMKAQIEHDQINGDHTYQASYGKSIATIAGLNLPSSIPIIEVLVSSQTLKDRGRKALNWKYLPKWIKPFLKGCWTVAFNLFGLVFGSGMIDKENTPKFKGIRPFIGDLHDLTNPDKTITDHPFIIGHYVTRIAAGSG
ncbi:hypothetical protein SYNPS1DRAFT_20910 [Syncephalis pseudoplumigaleata]|uniref:Uncharacterized protein n=1 Tax=Syncephalis pseudoplumigaleata TaxID=1712513 RepID=A0A4P9Z6V0_9FUNG|nr:hypothetical protein SYNPS1DRAFT_20910 [Syncephalis pseudoplumigaleata]|eukprot:RKP27601.1 hypothetical protein SYNPS1DRAFT_20910 [Syncephalis pseudoplumigaleata]